MHWIVILQIIASILYVGYLIHCYSLKTVGWFVKISVYLTWLICFSNVVLLPYDIYYSLHQDFAMGVVWKTSYFLIFFLTWLLLPVAQEYQGAGQFSIGKKLKRAIINNLIIYGIFALIGVVGLAYLLISKKVSLSSLPPLLLAASNAFGMFLLVIFLSYGLIKIPKQMWRYRNYKLTLKNQQFSASLISRKKDSVLHQLELKVKEILWTIKKDGETPETVSILNLVPNQYLDKWNRNIPNLGRVDPIKAHKQIKQLILQLGRLESRWEQITISAFKIEDILNYMDSHNHRIQSTIFQHYKYDILNFLQWLWHCRLKKWLIPIGAIILSIFAIAVIIAEITVFIPKISVINPFSHITDISSFVPMDLILLTVLAYIAFCIYYALFKLKFSNFYGLYWNQQTDAASLIFFAINCSRISNALNYNFLQVVQDEKSSFVQSMGQTNVFPVFGDTFRFFFPVLLILLILFNAFDVYEKICKMLGLSKFRFENQFTHENIDQGKRLLQKARTDLQNKILNNNCKNLSEFRSYQSEVPYGSYSFQLAPTATEQMTSKNSSSSDKIQLKGAYFNQYPNMQNVEKIFNM